MLRSVWRGIRRQGRERDILLQSLKAAGAALLAWIIAELWLGAPLAFLAPWVALVMVHATVYRSVVRGVQQVLAVVIGVCAATGGYLLIGDRTLTLAIVLVVTMPFAYLREFGDQGTYGATTALLVLTSGEPSLHQLLSRLMETGLGTAVGVVVNAAILPPVHLRDAREASKGVAAELRALLERSADGLRETWDQDRAHEWLRQAERVSGHVEDAWAAVRWGRESMRFNLRRRTVKTGQDLSPVLLPLEVVAKQMLGVQRALLDSLKAGMPQPDAEFVAFHVDVLDHGAAVVRSYCHRHIDTPGPPASGTDALREDNERLHEHLCAERFRTDGWLPYQALCVQLDRLLSGLGDLLGRPSAVRSR